MSSSVLIPYWLSDLPWLLEDSDHWYWFNHLFAYDQLIFIGPYIPTTTQQLANSSVFCLNTPSLAIALSDIQEQLEFLYHIKLNDISLFWHVIEASATCRFFDLHLLNCPRIAVIGDTHHLTHPISSLFPYLQSEPFTHICCSHNQYNPFFSSYLQLTAIDFPFCIPPFYNNVDRHLPTTHRLTYYGSLTSKNHLHRSRFVNTLLLSRLSCQLSLHNTSTFKSWALSFRSPQHNLTCSLNGTFSFQTWIPMLYGSCIYSDHLTPSNWFGSKLISHNNSFLYSSIDELVSAYELCINSRSLFTSISKSAHSLVVDTLFSSNYTRKYWLDSNFHARTYTTHHEQSLSYLLTRYLNYYGSDSFLHLIYAFESIQEHHRRIWKPKAHVYIALADIERFPLSELVRNLFLLLPRFIYNCSFLACENLTYLQQNLNSFIPISSEKGLLMLISLSP